MESNQKLIAVLVLATSLGAAGGSLSTAALMRETGGDKTYHVHQLSVTQTPQGDGSELATVTVCGDVTLALKDGGTSNADTGCVPCPLDKPSTAALQTIMTQATSCVMNAP